MDTTRETPTNARLAAPRGPSRSHHPPRVPESGPIADSAQTITTLAGGATIGAVVGGPVGAVVGGVIGAGIGALVAFDRHKG
jgi:hypothetical protein